MDVVLFVQHQFDSDYPPERFRVEAPVPIGVPELIPLDKTVPIVRAANPLYELHENTEFAQLARRLAHDAVVGLREPTSYRDYLVTLFYILEFVGTWANSHSKNITFAEVVTHFHDVWCTDGIEGVEVVLEDRNLVMHDGHEAVIHFADAVTGKRDARPLHRYVYRALMRTPADELPADTSANDVLMKPCMVSPRHVQPTIQPVDHTNTRMIIAIVVLVLVGLGVFLFSVKIT